MAKLLFRLNGVSDDEADDVRTLLQEHAIEIYETNAGRWLIGVAAIWLPDETEYVKARALIDAYQAERYQRLQQENTHNKQSVLQSLIGRLWQSPLEFLMVMLALLFVLGVSIYPFMSF